MEGNQVTEPSDTDLQKIESSLDELWADLKALAPPPKSRPELKLVEAEDATKALYLNEKNWTRTRGIALIHKETNSCLGNFAEYAHNKVRACRKLVREEAPLSVESIEYVSGTWWMGSNDRPQSAEVWHTRRNVTLFTLLDEIGVAPVVPLTVFLSYGAIVRVELAELTRFAAWHEDTKKSSEKFIDIPAHTNILPVMSRSCKIALRELLAT